MTIYSARKIVCFQEQRLSISVVDTVLAALKKTASNALRKHGMGSNLDE